MQKVCKKFLTMESANKKILNLSIVQDFLRELFLEPSTCFKYTKLCVKK